MEESYRLKGLSYRQRFLLEEMKAFTELPLLLMIV